MCTFPLKLKEYKVNTEHIWCSMRAIEAQTVNRRCGKLIIFLSFNGNVHIYVPIKREMWISLSVNWPSWTRRSWVGRHEWRHVGVVGRAPGIQVFWFRRALAPDPARWRSGNGFHQRRPAREKHFTAGSSHFISVSALPWVCLNTSCAAFVTVFPSCSHTFSSIRLTYYSSELPTQFLGA